MGIFNIQEKISQRILQEFYADQNITPEKWDKVILKINFTIAIYIAIVNAVIGIVLTLLIYFILNSINISLPWWVFCLSVVGISFMYTIPLLGKEKRIIKVPNGKAAVLTLFGDRKGEREGNSLLLSDGNFRQLMDIPFFGRNIVGAVALPRRLPSFEYTYEKVLSSDSVSFNGRHSFLGHISDPYVFVDFILSVLEEIKCKNNGTVVDPLLEVKNIVEEISLKAMKDAYDQLPHTKIIEEQGTENLYKIYTSNITDFDDKNRECKQPLPDFFTGESHPATGGNAKNEAVYIPQIGVTGSFLIKTSELPTKLQDKYDEASTLEKFKEIEKAKNEVNADKIETSGKAQARVDAYAIQEKSKTTLEQAEKAYERFHAIAQENGGASFSQIMQQVRLATDMVSNEFELVVGGADGKTPKGILMEAGISGQNADVVLLSMIKKFGLKKEFDEFFEDLSNLDQNAKKEALRKALTSK